MTSASLTLTKEEWATEAMRKSLESLRIDSESFERIRKGISDCRVQSFDVPSPLGISAPSPE